MNNQAVNIFDLLGGVNTEETRTFAGSKPVAGFDLLLGGLLGLAPVEDNQANIEPVLTGGTSKELPFAALFNPVINEKVETTDALVADETIENFNFLATDKIVKNDNQVLTNHAKALTILEPVQLENKSYQIVSMDVANNNVSFVLKDDTNPEQTIKINIPVELVEKSLTQQSFIENNRINLDSVKQTPIEKLFKELKIENIEISPVETEIESDDVRKEFIKLDFVNPKENKRFGSIIENKNLNPVSVKQVITPNNITNVKYMPTDEQTDVVPKAKAEQPVIKNHNISTTVEQAKPVATPTIRPATVGKAAVIDDSNSFSKSEKFDLLGISADSNRPVTKLTAENSLLQNNHKQFIFNGMTDSTAADVDTSDELNTIFGSDKFDFNVSHNNKETTIRSVRFTLPETLNNAQKTGHQSISLKFNPDDLGPAKLNLSLTHDDKLRARVMVTSPEAKIVLEQSVDRLVDQLNKLNIKVDLIDIHVASENNQEQMFSRHSHRHHKMTNRNLGQNDNLDTKDHIQPMSAGSMGVVSASGVDVLA